MPYDFEYDIYKQPGRGRELSERRQLLILMLPMIGGMLSTLFVWLSISPGFLSRFVSDGMDAYALLDGYSRWTFNLITACIAGLVVVILGIAATVIFVLRHLDVRDKMFSSGLLLIVVALCLHGIGWLMVISEDVPGLMTKAGEDIAQLESGQLEQATVWLNPKHERARLPGPYGDGQPEPVTEYHGISFQTDGRWVDFLVPDALGFSLDPDAMYSEEHSIDWNEQHARQYRIAYTSNLRIAVSIEGLALP